MFHASRQQQRVAVIGAGPSGLSVLRAFESARRKGDTTGDVDVVCFDKTNDIGGLWNFSWRTDTDEHGEHEHRSQYKQLFINAPKECYEFADYSFVEHFGKPTGAYPPQAAMRDYLTGRARQWDLDKKVRLNTSVQNVTYCEEDGLFTVRVVDYGNQTPRSYSERFDYVIVCTGHFSVPNMPEFEGLNDYQGNVLHSHNFKTPHPFVDRRVLIVGGSYSAEDLAMMIVKFGGTNVVISSRGRLTALFGAPGHVTKKPIVKRFTKTGAEFTNGETADFDDVILCTGYKHHFPFMDSSLRLFCPNLYAIKELYKGIFLQTNPKCMYIGAHDQLYSFTLFDVQAWYARDFVLGRLAMPGEADRKTDIDSWWQGLRAVDEATAVSAQAMYAAADDYQSAYMRDLTSDYGFIDYALCRKQFLRWVADREANCFTYRDGGPFKSYVSGAWSTKQSTTWLRQFDTSIQAYLDDAVPTE